MRDLCVFVWGISSLTFLKHSAYMKSFENKFSHFALIDLVKQIFIFLSINQKGFRNQDEQWGRLFRFLECRPPRTWIWQIPRSTYPNDQEWLLLCQSLSLKILKDTVKFVTIFFMAQLKILAFNHVHISIWLLVRYWFHTSPWMKQ